MIIHVQSVPLELIYFTFQLHLLRVCLAQVTLFALEGVLWRHCLLIGGLQILVKILLNASIPTPASEGIKQSLQGSVPRAIKEFYVLIANSIINLMEQENVKCAQTRL